jgi:hypothetical protein
MDLMERRAVVCQFVNTLKMDKGERNWTKL